MRHNPALLRWDLIAAFPVDSINNLLRHAHILRLSLGTDIQGIGGTVAIPNSRVSHVLADYRFGPPSLTFTEGEYEQPRIHLAMTVEGGTQRVVEAPGKLLALSAHDPLDPLAVQLDLYLQPDPRGVVMDLGKGEELAFDIGRTQSEKDAGGAFIKAVLDGLDEGQRVHALARFLADEVNPFLAIGHLGSRMHVSKTGQRLALVLFISMIHGPAGSFPVQGSDFPFLLPDELAASDASTALISLRLVHRAAYGSALLGVLKGGEFEYRYDVSKDLSSMVAKKGGLEVPASEWNSSLYAFKSDAFELPAVDGENALSAEFSEDEIAQQWQSSCSVKFRHQPVAGGTWQERTATFDVSLNYLFYLDADERREHILRGELFSPVESARFAKAVQGLPPDIDPVLREHIQLFVAEVLHAAFVTALNLTAEVPEQLLEGLQLADASRLQPARIEKPHDLAVFGPIGQGDAGFAIVEQGVRLAAAQRQQFSVQPPREGVQWSLQSLDEVAGDIGRIDAEGLYRAPPGHAMGTGPTRLLVMATDPGTGQRAVALVIALKHSVSVNPLISVCANGDELAFSAGVIGKGPLTWTLEAQEAGGGMLQPGDQGRSCTFRAGPNVPKQTYVLEEIKVQDAQSGGSRSVHVLVQQHEPALRVSMAAQPLPGGQLQFIASLNGEITEAEWQVRLGAGAIDASGVYTPDLLAPEHFALITGLVDGGKYGVFEGHHILPLPLLPASAAPGTPSASTGEVRA
ncbi:hypothetical protein [Pseudomonas reidholzensis]|nr:hypothetical protein [Pseudomonas reidholzensis]